MLKFKKDVVVALSTVAGALVALFALFVTIPVWFEAVVITLTAVGLIATISEIVKAYRASYDEETSKHTYKFPVRAFVLGTLVLVAVASIILLSLKRLFGFALIPVAVLLAVLFVIALLKKLRIMKLVVGLLLAILVVAIVGYATSALVHSGVNLNPGVSVETTVPETETTVPETEVPETEAPETEAPETETPETETPETEVPETEAPEAEAPVVDAPVVEDKETDATDKETVEDVKKPEETQPTTPETEVPETDYTPVIVKINAPETMSYAEPITITLEGIKAEDLKFGNEDFLSIVILSDSEVEVTLIGIVNDAGEVEFVPAAGYITVTDSVTGAHVTIEIVE